MTDHSLLSQAGQVPSTQRLRGLLPVATQSWHSPTGISLWDPARTIKPILLGLQCNPLFWNIKEALWPLWLSVLAMYPGPELESEDAGHWLPSFNK